MKVLLVANTDWYLYNFRLSLAKYLRNQGDEVVCVSPAGGFVSEIEAAGFRWIEWNVDRKGSNPFQEMQSIARLKRIYHQEQPDLVHHFTIKPVLYGMVAVRLEAVRASVNSITGLGYLFLQNGFSAHIRRQLVTRIYRWALGAPRTAVIFENSSDREFFLSNRLVQPEATSVINGVGVDVDVFTTSPEPDGDPMVIFPARMLWDKGVGTLIEASRLLRRKHPVRIIFVGEPDPGNPASVPEATIQQWVKEGLVEWWGFCRNMASVYQSGHIVTLPSLGEGLPTALIEASACARPIVTTDVPGCRDIVTDGVNGFLVPPNQPDALAEALERLYLDKPLRERMGAAGREIVLDRFTTTLVNQKTMDVYRSVLDQYQRVVPAQ